MGPAAGGGGQPLDDVIGAGRLMAANNGDQDLAAQLVSGCGGRTRARPGHGSPVQARGHDRRPETAGQGALILLQCTGKAALRQCFAPVEQIG
jgi:hypothetical protein